MSREASDRFLRAFNDVDRLLRQRVGLTRSVGFYEVVNEASRSDPAVSTHSVDLREFADLRNAIVHGGANDGRAIAEPHPETVAKLETILDRLRTPPKLGELFRRDVVRAEVGDPVGLAARAMLEGGFSQVPIYDGSEFVELLTAETVTRWVAHEFSSEIGLLEEVPIRDVLPFTEDPEHYLFVSRRATAYEALAAFDKFAGRGKYLDAILITDSGAKNQRPLGIVTTFDLPALHDSVEFRAPRSAKSARRK